MKDSHLQVAVLTATLVSVPAILVEFFFPVGNLSASYYVWQTSLIFLACALIFVKARKAGRGARTFRDGAASVVFASCAALAIGSVRDFGLALLLGALGFPAALLALVFAMVCSSWGGPADATSGSFRGIRFLATAMSGCLGIAGAALLIAVALAPPSTAEGLDGIVMIVGVVMLIPAAVVAVVFSTSR